MLGWVDNPKMVTTEDLWSAAYGEKPAHIFGSVGNSNIKPEQVRGGSSLSANPYEQYKYAFKNYLPESKLKNDLAQYDPQAAVATIAYTNLAKAGKIDKI